MILSRPAALAVSEFDDQGLLDLPAKPVITVTFAGEAREELLTLKQMIEDGSIRPVIDKIYLPGQATRAHERVETEQRVGIVVISMQDWLQHNQGSE